MTNPQSPHAMKRKRSGAWTEDKTTNKKNEWDWENVVVKCIKPNEANAELNPIKQGYNNNQKGKSKKTTQNKLEIIHRIFMM